MILKNLPAGTAQSLSNNVMRDVWLGVSGTGSVAIEFLGDDGTYRSYPESTFTAPTAKVVTIKACQYRFNVTGGPITIELASD